MMKRWRVKPQHYVIAAVISFLIAAINFSGIVLRDDVPGRFIVGAVWSVVGIAWSSRYYYARLRTREREVLDLRENLLAQARDAAAQQERNRLARELHDSIKQQIFSISMSSAAVEARWDTDPQGAREALDDVRRSAQEAMAEMNALLQQLSPAPLEKVGLVQALRDQCEALGYRTDADVTMAFGEFPADDRWPAGVQESLFRIAQEALSNIARHARADHVRLYVGQRDADGPLTLEVQDDGQGFEVGATEGGMGLGNIRQRVQALGGKLTIESALTRGTRIRIAIPLAEPLILREETAQNHILNKVFLTGLAGGLALIATLWYPLYHLVPGGYVDGWPAGSKAVGLILQIGAVLLTIGTGFLAARWVRPSTRQANTLWGALAGAVAGVIAYFGIIASTACLIGGGTLLERGLIPANGRADAVHLLAEAVIGIIWWAYGAFWASLLAGTGLGAIGGLLIPPALRPSEQPDLWPVARTILTGLVIVSALSFVSAAFIFGLFEPTIHTGLLVNGVSLETTWLIDYASDWLIGTPMLFYIASLISVYFLLRPEIRETGDPARLRGVETLAALLGFISFGVPVCLATISTTSAQGTVKMPNGWMDVSGLLQPSAVSVLSSVSPLLLVIGVGGSLVMGSLYLAAMNTVNRRQRATGLCPSPFAPTIAIMSLPLSLGIGVWAMRLSYSHVLSHQLLGIALGAGVVVGNVVIVVMLLRTPQQPSSHQAPRILAAVLSLSLSPVLISWALSIPPFNAWIGILIAIVNIALIINLLRPSKHPYSRIAPMRPQTMLLQWMNAGLGTVIVATTPLMTIISIQIGIGLITNQLVEVLIGYESSAQEFTLVELVRSLYLNQMTALLTTLLATAVAAGLLTLVISGMMAIAEQFEKDQEHYPHSKGLSRWNRSG